MSTDTAALPASQRFDLRRIVMDEVLDRVEQSLQVRLDAEAAVRKRRSIGFRSDRGTWIRVECRGLERLEGQGWGLEASTMLHGVARPDWYAGVSWFDTTRGVMWHADETTLIEDAPVERSSAAFTLSGEWWVAWDASMDALAAHSTSRIATPDCQPLTQQRIDAAVLTMFPGVQTTIEEQATAHADLNWANLTGPNMWILDWEDWGTGPRGLDAASLWFTSLSQPAVADKVLVHRAADLESRTGRLMMLWRCAEFLGWAGEDEPAYGAAKQAAERLAGELR